MQQRKITVNIQHIAELARLPLTEKQKVLFSSQLDTVLAYMTKIQQLNTADVPETAQVTGLENIYRDDVIDEKRMFTQKQALQNAKHVYKGFFIVPSVFD